MQTLEKIISELLAHDISKHEAIKAIREVTESCYPSAMIEMNVDSVAFTALNNHGILNLKAPYQYDKIKTIRRNDKVLIMRKP